MKYAPAATSVPSVVIRNTEMEREEGEEAVDGRWIVGSKR